MVKPTAPDCWVVTNLGSVVDYGKTQKCELADINGVTWVVELEDIEKDTSRIISREYTPERNFKSSKNKFNKGDVLYGKLRPYLNKVVMADEDGVCSTEIIPVNAEPLVSNKYIFHWFKCHHFLDYVNNVSYGVNMPRLGTKDGLNAPFILAPFAEQKEIADRLDKLLAQVEATQARLARIPDIIKQFRQSVLAAAVSGKLTEEWRNHEEYLDSKEQIFTAMKLERKSAWLSEQEKSYHRNRKKFIKDELLKKYSEPSDKYQDDFELTQIKKIPHQWVATNLDNISIAVTGKTPSTSDQDNWGGEIPFISPSQILPDGSVTPPERYVTEKGATKAPLLPNGAVMIVCIGTIGKVGLLRTESTFNQQINALIPTKSIKSEYLFYWSQTLHAWLNKTSSAVVNAAIINKSRLCEAPCPLPSVAEQTEIVRRVEQLFAYADSIEQQAKAAKARVDNLTQAILAKAFRGELTADWRAANPDLISGDNSAAALLARIQAERAQSAKKSRKRTQPAT